MWKRKIQKNNTNRVKECSNYSYRKQECGWKGWGEISYGGLGCVKRATIVDYLVTPMNNLVGNDFSPFEPKVSTKNIYGVGKRAKGKEQGSEQLTFSQNISILKGEVKINSQMF